MRLRRGTLQRSLVQIGSQPIDKVRVTGISGAHGTIQAFVLALFCYSVGYASKCLYLMVEHICSLFRISTQLVHIPPQPQEGNRLN
jgi:hypothetical protein